MVKRTIRIALAAVASIAAIVIVYILLINSIWQISQNPRTQNEYGLYVYLFRFNPSLDEHAYLEYMPPLYEKVVSMTGMKEPTFEQAHYSVSREGVYNNIVSGETIERLMPVNIIVSDSIKKPDGSQLKAEDIVPDTRFYYSGVGTARLITDENGRVYSYTQEFPPIDLEKATGDQRVFTLFIESSDYQKVNARYEEIKNTIESFELTNTT